MARNRYCWMYLLEPEDGRVPDRCRLVRVLKGVLWYAAALMLGLGLGQLS